MGPHGSPQDLEMRRGKAISLLERKLSLREIARLIGCHASSVLRWRDAWRRGGRAALKAKPVPGRPPFLSQKQKRQLVDLLLQGAMAHGYCTELWTTLRIAAVIEQRFGVKYHRNHISKLLHQLGWSHQKPERRAIERNAADIEQWKRTVRPAVKKTPQGWQPTSSSPMKAVSS